MRVRRVRPYAIRRRSRLQCAFHHQRVGGVAAQLDGEKQRQRRLYGERQCPQGVCVRRNEVMAFVRSAVGNRAAAIVSGVVFWTILQISQPALAVEAADLSPRYEANVELS